MLVDFPRVNPAPGCFAEGEFTLVEHADPGNRGLEVRPVSAEEQATVRSVGGLLFPTTVEAQEFANGEMLYGDKGPPVARQAFSHKRVDGLRIYVHLGQSA